MTIEEKMEHFKSVSLENASKKSNNILISYKKSLDEQFEKHKEEAIAHSKAMEEARLGSIKLEAKRALAKAQAEEKRKVTLHQAKLKTDIFNLVNERLDNFKKTEAYPLLLVKQIQTVLDTFQDTNIIFYIDASDQAQMDFLKKETGADIEISPHSFLGGSKAIIESRNMLVDNSFKTKLTEEQETFTICNYSEPSKFAKNKH